MKMAIDSSIINNAVELTSLPESKKLNITLKLPQLQNCCKRDPVCYKADYDAQIRRLESECEILHLSPTYRGGDNIIELIQFAAAVSSSSYKGEECEKIKNILKSLLLGRDVSNLVLFSKNLSKDAVISSLHKTTAATHLNRDIRKSCVSALILMRNKGALDPLELYEISFRLLVSVPDKNLREMLNQHIVKDVVNVNRKKKINAAKVNREFQSFLHKILIAASCEESKSMIEEGNVLDTASRRAVQMVGELYRRNIWTDSRSVCIMACAAKSMNSYVMTRAIRFFLNIEEKMDLDCKNNQQNVLNGAFAKQPHLFSKKTKARKRHVQKQKKNRCKIQTKLQNSMYETEYSFKIENDVGVQGSKKLYPAMELLHDAQSLAEILMKRIKSSPIKLKFEVKLLMLNFVTRLVGNHRLLLLNLYPLLQKYLGGYQRDVTAILSYTVQSCHEFVPPEEIYGILKTILHNFVTERCSEEQIAVGINSIRVICARVPSVLSDSDSNDFSATSMDIHAFVQDLASYTNHRDRSINIAARAFVNHIRQVYPSLLPSKHRGSVGTALHRAHVKPLSYGEQKVSFGVAGADLLYEYESNKQIRNQEDIESDDEPNLIDLTKITPEERKKVQLEMSSNRIFSTHDFIKMRKLLEKQETIRKNPRAAAQHKRSLESGNIQMDDDLSESENCSSDDDFSEEGLHIPGIVNPDEIMAMSKKKRMNKYERLNKVLEGRTAFQAKQREGGSTNIEKNRNKNFKMTKFAMSTRKKLLSRKKPKKQMKHDAKKRRRKV